MNWQVTYIYGQCTHEKGVLNIAMGMNSIICINKINIRISIIIWCVRMVKNDWNMKAFNNGTFIKTQKY